MNKTQVEQDAATVQSMLIDAGYMGVSAKDFGLPLDRLVAAVAYLRDQGIKLCYETAH